jgi:hypothetical protein
MVGVESVTAPLHLPRLLALGSFAKSGYDAVDGSSTGTRVP